MAQKKLVLKIIKGSKKFLGNIAVENVDFEVYSGEVHAIVGENGAGKSTLMKIIAGLYNDYTGKIIVNGEEVKLHSPSRSKEKGIGMIYQELSLAPPISIAENILVGKLPVKGGFLIDKKAIYNKTKNYLNRVGLNLDPFKLVEEISQHEAQLVEIAKVLANNPSIIVMDEPTSALSSEEVDRLFDIIRNLKKQGLAVLYISHHLSEIFKIADKVTAMRDGKIVGTKYISETTREELAGMMVGGSLQEYHAEHKILSKKEKFRVEKISRYGFFHNISFHVNEGEILGIFGLSGAGRTELACSICGIDPMDKGEIYLDGKKINPKSLRNSLMHGISYLTESRKTQGLFLRLSTGKNILATLIPGSGRGFLYSSRNSKEIAKDLIEKLQIVPPDVSKNVNNLSGGNQQKVLLAKWLATEPIILFLDQPTRGVDIGAKSIIHKAILKLAEKGNSVVLMTSDLPELIGLSDRVMIMREGHFVKEMQKEDCTEESVLIAANEDKNYLG